MARRTIRVGSLARVEGEGGIEVTVKDGAVTDVKLDIFEPPRFFEALLRGRRMHEAHERVEASQDIEHALLRQMHFTAQALLVRDETSIERILRENNRFNNTLAGLEATSHWASLDQLRELGARPTLRRVVVQGKIVTAAGVSSGIDMALTLAARIAGDEVAQSIQLGIEYDPQPPFRAGSPEMAPPHIVERQRARLRERMGPSAART